MTATQTIILGQVQRILWFSMNTNVRSTCTCICTGYIRHSWSTCTCSQILWVCWGQLQL